MTSLLFVGLTSKMERSRNKLNENKKKNRNNQTYLKPNKPKFRNIKFG